MAKEFNANGSETDASAATPLVIDTAAPSSTAGIADTTSRNYALTFNETIVFAAGGSVDMLQGGTAQARFAASGGNWTKPADNQLLFSMASFNGLFKMQLSTAAIQDVAGNAAIVGVPHLEFDLPLSS